MGVVKWEKNEIIKWKNERKQNKQLKKKRNLTETEIEIEIEQRRKKFCQFVICHSHLFTITPIFAPILDCSVEVITFTKAL